MRILTLDDVGESELGGLWVKIVMELLFLMWDGVSVRMDPSLQRDCVV